MRKMDSGDREQCSGVYEELLSNLVYGLGRVPVRLFRYLLTVLELDIVDHKGQQIKSTNPLPALLRGF